MSLVNSNVLNLSSLSVLDAILSLWVAVSLIHTFSLSARDADLTLGDCVTGAIVCVSDRTGTKSPKPIVPVVMNTK